MTDPLPDVGEIAEAPAGQTSQWPALDMGLVQATAVVPPAFDWGFVPPGWADYIQGVAQDRGTPPDYVFAAALVACATALGNSRRAHPWADWFEPAHLWVAVVGHPSSGKTPAITPLLDGLKRLEADELDAFAPIRLEHARAVEVAKATAERWEKDVKDAIKNNTPAPDKPAAAEPPDGDQNSVVPCSSARSTASAGGMPRTVSDSARSAPPFHERHPQWRGLHHRHPSREAAAIRFRRI